MDRRERFDRLFQMIDREDLAGSLQKLCSVMMDLRFDERDVNMAWYLSQSAPEALSEAVSGRMRDVGRTADEVSARTMLDREKLSSFLGDIVGEGPGRPDLDRCGIRECMEPDDRGVGDADAG